MERSFFVPSLKLNFDFHALPDRALDALAELSVRRKVTGLLLFFGVAAPLFFLAVLHGQGPEQAQSALVLFLAAMVILLVPLSAFASHVLCLRSIRTLNAQCLRLKRGDFALEDLPPERGEEHDFQRLRRNLHWMGYALKSREERLAATVEKLADAQREIGESLEYASQIQRAFLPGPEAVGALLARATGPGGAEHFHAVRQLGSVGGDACWCREFPGGFWVGTVDCTGHGVPGAFMTLIVHALFDQAARAQEAAGCNSPGALIGRVNRLIKEALGQFGAGSLSDDGMDCSLCRVDLGAGRLTFAGARGALYIVRNGQVDIVKGGAKGAGYVRTPMDAHYEDTDMALEAGQRFYMATDGLTDQVGGPERLPFGRRRFMEYLEQSHDHPLSGQGRELMEIIDIYRGAETQRDDLTVLGFALTTRSGQ
jgi:serine phosphatase RsbU (regulator of sigma subunit)